MLQLACVSLLYVCLGSHSGNNSQPLGPLCLYQCLFFRPLITISTHLSRSKLSDLLATLSLGLSCQPQVEQIFKHQSFLFVVWWDEKIFDELFHICSLGLIK